MRLPIPFDRLCVIAGPSNYFMIIALLGTLLLLFISMVGKWSDSAALKSTRVALVRARTLLIAIMVALLWIVGARFWFPLPLAYANTNSAQVAVFCIQHLHESQPVPGEYILILEGSSVTSRGLDGAALERSLRAAGIPATVIQLSMSGANHLERLQLLQNFARLLSAKDWQRLDKSRLILGHEVQALYDRDPLLNYGNNPFTATTLAYSNPDNLPILIDWISKRYDLRELWKRRSDLQLVPTQFLYNALRISYFQLPEAGGTLAPAPGFQPAPQRADFHPAGLLPIDFPPGGNFSGRRSYQRVTRWNIARNKEFRSVFKGSVRSELFFSLPGWLPYEFHYDNWWSNAHPDQLFFNGNRPQIRAHLREPELWNDPGHLAKAGAAIYTEEFAAFLKEHWLAQPG
jgi:hypothetical protein